jgi:hypothetical protein
MKSILTELPNQTMASTTNTSSTTSAWDSFKGFWMTHHNLRRHPFAPPGEPKRTGTSSFWSDFKGFWMTHHNLRRHPFASKV